MALFADTLDHVEWKTGFRTDGTAMSIYSIIAVAIGGICTGVFNGLLGSAGYIAPEDSLQPITQTLEQMFTWGRNNGVNFQTFIQNTTTNTWMTVFNQSDAVTNVITFAFVGLEVITGIVLAGLLIFLGVEKTIKKKQTLIREAQKVAWEKEGKVWIEPEIRAAEEQRLLDEESEKVFRDELALKCDKKGLNYNELLQKHLSEQKNKETKRIENERKNEEKLRIALEKEEKSLQKKKDKFNSLLNSRKSKIETRRKLREEREQNHG